MAENKYPILLPISQLIINLFLIIGGFSIFLFIIGYVNNFIYYTTLGIPVRFLDFQPYEYEAAGLITILYSLFAIPPLLDLFFTWLQLRMIKNDATLLASKIKSLPKKKIEVRNIIRDLKTLENTFWERPRHIFNLYFLIFLLGIVFSIRSYFHNNTAMFFLLIVCDIQILIFGIILYALTLVKKRGKWNNRINMAKIFVFVFFLIVFIFPGLLGYLQAQYILKSNNFRSYSLQLKSGGKIKNAEYVYFGKNNYFFFINKQLSIIPESEINLLKRN